MNRHKDVLNRADDLFDLQEITIILLEATYRLIMEINRNKSKEKRLEEHKMNSIFRVTIYQTTQGFEEVREFVYPGALLTKNDAEKED